MQMSPKEAEAVAELRRLRANIDTMSIGEQAMIGAVVEKIVLSLVSEEVREAYLDIIWLAD